MKTQKTDKDKLLNALLKDAREASDLKDRIKLYEMAITLVKETKPEQVVQFRHGLIPEQTFQHLDKQIHFPTGPKYEDTRPWPTFKPYCGNTKTDDEKAPVS